MSLKLRTLASRWQLGDVFCIYMESRNTAFLLPTDCCRQPLDGMMRNEVTYKNLKTFKKGKIDLKRVEKKFYFRFPFSSSLLISELEGK